MAGDYQGGGVGQGAQKPEFKHLQLGGPLITNPSRPYWGLSRVFSKLLAEDHNEKLTTEMVSQSTLQVCVFKLQ